MRRLLGSVLPAVLLAGIVGGLLSACGDDEAGVVTDDPAPSASSTTSSGAPTKGPAGDAVDFELARTVTETAAGGDVVAQAVPLSDDTAVQQFVAPFNDSLQVSVQSAVQATDVPDDRLLYGAVIAVGCDVPDDVTVTAGDSGLEIRAVKVANPKQECFAAMTTVALVLVPADAVD